MKSIISKSLILAGIACAAFTSCTEDMEYKDVHITPVTTFYEPSNDAAIQLQASATASLFFEWESAKCEDGGAPLYEVVFDEEGGDFSDPLYKALADNNGMQNYATISHKMLNKIAANAGIPSGESGTLRWTVQATRGINGVLSKEFRNLTIQRLVGFAEVPSSIYLTGEATEGGNDFSKAMLAASPEGGVFEIFASLKAGKSYRLVSGEGSDAMTFHVDGTRILEGDGESTVSEDGVYRIELDFSIASAKLRKIDKVEFYFCPSGGTLFEMPYEGNGVFSAVATVNFKQESWGKDQRYKFLMTYADGTKQFWGTKNNTDSNPGSVPAEDPYFFIAETEDNQWDQKWKLNDEFDGASARYSVIFNVTNYTHRVELANSNPDEGGEEVEEPLTTPDMLQLNGDATEDGDIQCTKINDNTFEVFTKLTANKNFTITDGSNEYKIEDGTLAKGNNAYTVEKDGVYCVTLDFENATAEFAEVTNLSVFNCWDGKGILDLTYVGKGEWSATGLAFPEGDDRYKFVMTIGGNTQFWGPVNDSEDEKPSNSQTPENEYYNMKRTNPGSQWDNKWKFEDKFKGNSNVKVTVKLHDTYTHTIE